MKWRFLLLSIPLVVFFLFPSKLPSSPADKPGTEEHWWGLYFNGDKIGYSQTISVDTGDSLEIKEYVKFQMTTFGVTQNIETLATYTLKANSLTSFEFEMKAGSAAINARGTRNAGAFDIEMHTVSGISSLSYPVDEKALVFPLLYKRLAELGPPAGEKLQMSIFDPSLIITGVPPEKMVAYIDIEGKETVKTPSTYYDTLRVRIRFIGTTSTVWINDRGILVKEFTEPGFISKLEGRAKATREPLANLDIVSKTAVSSNVSLKDARELKLLRVKIGGLDSTEDLQLSDGRRQSFESGIVEVNSEALESLTPYSIPYAGGDKSELTKPTHLIQSAHPEIAAVTQSILNGETDSLLAGRKLVDWVYNNLEKVPVISIPNALDVLKTKKGDCNEHATLLAALSRSAGIPTRIVLGLMYINGKFYYHAWNEMFVGGWITVDSTLGQVPADASHIKLLEGGLSRSSEIMRFLGKLKLEILDAS
ncbi:MAG: transglutaminase-like domain-containing protein [Thermodesulfobacteriota bacterium]